MWPVAFALTKLTAADEAKIRGAREESGRLNEHHHRHHPGRVEIRVERIFDAPRAHVYSVWTDPKLIRMVGRRHRRRGDGRPARPAPTGSEPPFGLVEGEFREVEQPERLVQTFQNHLQTLEFEDLGDRTS